MNQVKPYWVRFYKEGVAGSDVDIINMIEDVCDANEALRKMDCSGMYTLVFTHLAHTYNALRGFAEARGLKGIRQFT